MSTHAAFWDRIARKYSTTSISDMDAYEAGLARVQAWLKPDMSVLELGCGTGSTALRLAPHVARMHGTDVSAEMIRIAQEKADAEGASNTVFSQADAENAGQDASYDAVTAFNLLHLVADLDATLAHVQRLLPQGSLFISKTPCLGGKQWLRPLISVMQLIGKAPKPVSFLRPSRIEAALDAQGFEIVESGDYPKKLPSRLIIARKR